MYSIRTFMIYISPHYTQYNSLDSSSLSNRSLTTQSTTVCYLVHRQQFISEIRFCNVIFYPNPKMLISKKPTAPARTPVTGRALRTYPNPGDMHQSQLQSLSATPSLRIWARSAFPE